MAADCCLSIEGKKTFSASASAITFHINAMDKLTVETVKEKLTEKAQDLVTTIEIKDGVRGLSKHLTKKVESLSTSDVAIEIGENVDCCNVLQHLFHEKSLFLLLSTHNTQSFYCSSGICLGLPG